MYVAEATEVLHALRYIQAQLCQSGIRQLFLQK
jgi:hypothetical protein